MVSGLSATQQAMFTDGQARFQEAEEVPNNGLGPRFNSNSCSSCHAFPAVGGTSPRSNPQVQFANSRNTLPSFITANGPVREARFIKNPDGSPDGAVHALFTIDGRPDKPSGCNLNQENFSNTSNISQRIPAPTFGLGLIEAIPDGVLQINFALASGQKAALGISGRFNRTGTMAPSHALAGRHRTNLSISSPVKPTTSRWESPTWYFQTNAMTRRFVLQCLHPTTRST
jgi:hypothetical protein